MAAGRFGNRKTMVKGASAKALKATSAKTSKGVSRTKLKGISAKGVSTKSLKGISRARSKGASAKTVLPKTSRGISRTTLMGLSLNMQRLERTGAEPLRMKVKLRPGGVTDLLNVYDLASETSRRTGRPARFSVEVKPNQSVMITSIEATEDPHQSPLIHEERSAIDEALAKARQRGQRRVAEILSNEDMLSADEFAVLLGTTRTTVNTKRQNRQVLGLEGATRGFRFPEWQLDKNGKPFAAIPHLFERLGNDPWAVYRFLVQHHSELDGLTGREALERGKTRQAVDAAESVARNPA